MHEWKRFYGTSGYGSELAKGLLEEGAEGGEISVPGMRAIGKRASFC